MPFDPERLKAAKSSASGGFDKAKLDAARTPGASIVESFGRGVIGQERVAGFNIPNIAEEIGQAAGPLVGGIAGTPLGPLGIGAGAAAGRLAQTGFQNIGALAGSGVPIKSAGEAVKEAGIEGAINAATAGAAGLLGRTAATLKPSLVKAGAQALKVGPGIAEDVGQQVLKDPGILSRAKSVKDAGKAIGEV